MTRNEALKAAIDGKKIQMTHWDKKQYVRFDNEIGKFCYFDGCQSFFTHAMASNDIRDKNGVWQIVPETVSFATAWKAYEEGKTIQSEKYNKYSIKEQYDTVGWFLPCDIRGRWIVLEDC